MKGIKNLKGANTTAARRSTSNKLTIPLQNQLMKIIRQCEVYLMEEAVTDQIIKTTQMQIDPVLRQMNEYVPGGPAGQAAGGEERDKDIVDIQT